MATYRIAGVQMDVKIADVEGNRQQMADYLNTTVENGAEMTVFPECASTGYCFESLEEAMVVAESVDGPTAGYFEDLCRRLNTFLVYGFLETDGARLFNSLNLIGPKGRIGTYRKIHLPFLGVDRFSSMGESFEVFDLGFTRVGLHICYDGSFPESGRCLALKGADLLILPTNWPPGSGAAADVIPNARAMENHTYFLSVNRVGIERGFEFIGKSKLSDPNGHDLVFENHSRPAVFYGTIDPSIPRQKKLIRVPGKHEIDRFGDRRPEKYSAIVSECVPSDDRTP